MPLYQFTAPAGSPTLERRDEIARAVTRVHGEVTGAPAGYVQASFTAAEAGSTYLAGERADRARLVGLIRGGRSTSLKARLIHALADAWAEITGEPRENLTIFLQEIPGANVFEGGEILPEPGEQPGDVTD